MPLNEADCRAEFIEPKVRTTGWSDSLIQRNHFVPQDRAVEMVGCFQQLFRSPA